MNLTRRTNRVISTRNRKMVGWLWGTLSRNFFFRKENGINDVKRCILTLLEAMFWKLELRRNF